ncbi:Phosphoglycerate dehydrogenase [Microlunatus sagamiharensis]|uniref:Phosphoglycerate dehydrogenase n=1 Tax=Microlunatus sagamiharensis TaxID=546874 RepID=A0A1H2MH73_9ACTN|nr:2-hydroxyacid dehydrogenase [Microlunatus sagamiharensis]SDU92482.1 Phosphoglycerate dehydrogenase [Microlunatus sagamiharensis]
MVRAWVPYADLDEAERRLGGIPAGIEADCWKADDDTTPGSTADVEYVVLPYLRKGAERVLADLPALRVVQTLTAGVDDVAPYVPDHVTLCNAAGVHDASTAELAVALALASGRHLDEFARNQERGLWKRDFGTAIADRRVLILGYGGIGAAIEARLLPFEVASVTRVARRARTEPLVHPTSELLDLLAQTDVLFVIAPLTDETRGIIGAEALSRLPDGALVVNVARGPLVDTDALLAETSSGRLHAALDVTDPEPLPADHPLWHVENVLVSPHVGGASTAFFPRADRMIKAQLERLAAGEPLANVVRAGT